MARMTTTRVSDSESDGETIKSPIKSQSKHDASDVARGQNNGEPESPGEDEDEYEIEEILEAKRGAFPGGRIGYLVKWKGYSEEDNSWVDEDDIGNAREVVDAYWAKNKKEKKSGKPTAPKNRTSTASTSSKGRKTSVAQDDDSDIEEVNAPPKKRGRQSTTKASTLGSDSEELEELREKGRDTKKSKTTSSARKPKRTLAEAMDVDSGEDTERFVSMKKWAKLESWEDLVKSVDTVERGLDGELYVYFTLKNNQNRCREASRLCGQKMPQLMLSFYEKNLRWRSADGPDN